MNVVSVYDGSVQLVRREWVVSVTTQYGGHVHLQEPMGISRDVLLRLLPSISRGSGCLVFYSDKVLKVVGLDQYAGRDLLALLQGNFTAVGHGTVRWRLKMPCHY